MRRFLAAMLLATVALSPIVLAHGASTPADPFTRLLADQNDDCGGDGGAATGSCRGSDDLLALDVQEKWDNAAGHVLVFRFSLDKGKTYPVANTLTFSSPAGIKTLSMKTTDDGAFQNNGGFDQISSIASLNDGNRFIVDGIVKASTLGLNLGDTLSAFKVESKANNNLGDFMPGGCKTSLGTDCPAPAPGSDTTSYSKPSYALQGTGYYASLSGDGGSIQVPLNGDSDTRQLQVSNLFSHKAQTIMVSVEGAEGVTAGFHVGASMDGEYQATADVGLPAKGTTSLHLRLHGAQEGATGTLTISLTTDQGGRSQLQIPYVVTAAAVDDNSMPSTHENTVDGTSSSNKSPAAGIALVGVLAIAAFLRRRA